MKPKYKHYSKCCKYLGTIITNQAYDMYVCNHDTLHIIMVRFGNHRSNYISQLYGLESPKPFLSDLIRQFTFSTAPNIRALAVCASIVELEGYHIMETNV